MKKLLLIFVLLITLLLCSCRKINQPDDTNYTSSNSSDISSDVSSTTSDFVLPERPTSTTTSSEQEITTSDADNTASTESTVKTAADTLSIDVQNPYYRTSVKILSLTLYNEEKSKFTYYTDFFLQRYQDGKWTYCNTKDGEINYLFKTAESESHVQSILFDLSKLYNLPLSTGTYRIIQQSDDGTITSKSFEIVDDSFFDGEQE